jgi:hypothetical protein
MFSFNIVNKSHIVLLFFIYNYCICLTTLNPLVYDERSRIKQSFVLLLKHQCYIILTIYAVCAKVI